VSIRHCQFDKDDDENIVLEPFDERSSKFLCVNGKQVTSRIVLNHLDRVIIGTSTLFLFKIPGGTSSLKEQDIDYEFFMEEQSKQVEEEVQKFEESQPKQDLRASRALSSFADPNLYPEGSAQNVRASRIMSISSSETPHTPLKDPLPSDAEKTTETLTLEVPSTKQDEKPESSEHPEVDEPMSKKKQLHSKLAKLFPLISEANMLASDLNRHVKCSAKIINVLPNDVKDEEDLEPEKWDKELKVEVINSDYGLIWYWEPEKFEDRLCMLRELIDEEIAPSPDEDPLWDPPEETLIGKGYYSLKPLGLLFDNPFDILIISATGGDAGFLRMNIVPVEENGEMCEEGPDTPEELVGALINFRVEIHEARNLPQSHSTNVYCEFHFPGLGIRRTSIVNGYNEQPTFNWKEDFKGVLVDDSLARYMQNNKLAVSIFGTGITQKTEPPKRQTLSKPEPRPEVTTEKPKQMGKQNKLSPKHADLKSQQIDSKNAKNDGKKKDCLVF
jgi:hypothetical protein